jgi:hypothetical protein
MKRYVCEKYPFLRIGELAQFEHGVLDTNDAYVQRAVESMDWFNIFIKEVPCVGPTPMITSNSPVSNVGMRHTRPVTHDRTNTPPRDLPPVPEGMKRSEITGEVIPDPPPPKEPVDENSVRGLIRYSKQQLRDMADARGLEVPEGCTRQHLISMLVNKEK